MKNNKKLDQLTALRFFAALMIVIHHCDGFFGIKHSHIKWEQGVSFFFVLSGFILAYVYPNLETWPDVKKFWTARIARIWPAYLASFLIGFLLIRYGWDTKTGIAHLLMVQSWVPFSSYYFSYNAVAWSVSTEAFFYLVFPLLIYKWHQSWHIKFVFSALVLVAILALSNHLQLPIYGDPNVAGEGLMLTQHSLVYIHPVSRVFEFILGMLVTTLWQKKTNRNPKEFAPPTLIEIAAVLVCALSVYFASYVAHWGAESVLGASTGQWLVQSSSLFAFAFLIYVFAQGRGLVSKILRKPFLVQLGEISFSVYLLHQILLISYRKYLLSPSHIPDAASFLIFISILLLSSYLVWMFIEMPGRGLILSISRSKDYSILKTITNERIRIRAPSIAAVLLVFLVSIVHLSAKPTVERVQLDKQQIANLTPEKFKSFVGAKFQNRMMLKGLNLRCTTSDLILDMAWEKVTMTSGHLTNAVHLVNTKGEILAQADYAQQKYVASLSIGEVWLDKVSIPLKTIKPNIAAVAVGVYDQAGSLLTVVHKNTDWGGRRLVIHLDQLCSHTERI
jgi:peptidoglycan/LPS O-acetylase OafA/YrhL